ncbi:MAG: CGNR zinc finger domain-containing protein [Actinomycetota bacterium]
MNFSHYSEAPIRFAADLVNTGPLPVVGESWEDLKTVDDLRAFLLESGFLDAGDDAGALTEADLEAFRRLRAQFVEVFLASDAGEAARVVNGILDECRSVPHLTDHDDSALHLHFAAPEATPAQRAGASSGMGLALVLVEGGLSRFGVCASDDCVDVFVDTSKNSSRRFCSDKCANRTAVAAHRARERGKSH